MLGFGKKGFMKTNFEKGKKLGEGNFAEVFECKVKNKDWYTNAKVDTSVEKVAIKVINRGKVEDIKDVEREIEIMKKVNHKHVINLYDIDEKSDKNEIYLVMELVTGGELFDRIVNLGQYTEKQAAVAMAQLCNALHHLHGFGIVHRDLKPENILYATQAEDADLKLADFGLARIVSDTDVMKTACGTPGYVAPEILQNKGYSSGAVDMWSVGVIMYILLCGFPPFYEEELPALFDSIMKARYDFPSPWWDNISPGAVEMIKKLLTVNPEQRMTAEQALQHDWMKNAPEIVLKDAQKAIKKYNANRKLRKAALGIIAQQRMERALKDLRGVTAAAKAAE